MIPIQGSEYEDFKVYSSCQDDEYSSPEIEIMGVSFEKFSRQSNEFIKKLRENSDD